jgi:FKBP-type peptidyl-prolyl cis-trans isomerase FklB
MFLMNKLFFLFTIPLWPLLVSAQAKKTTPALPMRNLLDSFSYAAGLNVAGNMKDQGVTEINYSLMMKAIEDVLTNKPKLLSPEKTNMTLQEQLQIFAQKKMAAEKARGRAFLAENKTLPNVVSLPNGLQYEVIESGNKEGIHPLPVDTVVVNYIGTLVDGTEFDNSFKRGKPASFPLNGVIKGWTAILQMMVPGDKWIVYIPYELGYGEQGSSGTIPPGAALTFVIHLLEIKKAIQ